jgi:hypothetical protein
VIFWEVVPGYWQYPFGRRKFASSAVDGERIGSRRPPGEPDGMPPMIRIGWPLHPSVVDPRRFPEVAAAIARLAAEAYTALAQIEARGRL